MAARVLGAIASPAAKALAKHGTIIIARRTLRIMLVLRGEKIYPEWEEGIGMRIPGSRWGCQIKSNPIKNRRPVWNVVAGLLRTGSAACGAASAQHHPRTGTGAGSQRA